MKLLILVIILVSLLIYKQEGYQNNTPPGSIPDDIQFKSCHDFSNTNNLGNNNYRIRRHGIGEPLEGVYSHFLNTYNLRNYDEYFHSPICEGNYRFSNTSELTNRLIPDGTDTPEERRELYELEQELDARGLHNPDYLYVNPEFIENKLTYTEGINQMFLKNHRSHDEDNLHHRLDPELYR